MPATSLKMSCSSRQPAVLNCLLNDLTEFRMYSIETPWAPRAIRARTLTPSSSSQPCISGVCCRTERSARRASRAVSSFHALGQKAFVHKTRHSIPRLSTRCRSRFLWLFGRICELTRHELGFFHANSSFDRE